MGVNGYKIGHLILLKSVTFSSCHCTGLFLVYVHIAAFITRSKTKIPNSADFYSIVEGSNCVGFLYLFYSRVRQNGYILL